MAQTKTKIELYKVKKAEEALAEKIRRVIIAADFPSYGLTSPVKLKVNTELYGRKTPMTSHKYFVGDEALTLFDCKVDKAGEFYLIFTQQIIDIDLKESEIIEKLRESAQIPVPINQAIELFDENLLSFASDHIGEDIVSRKTANIRSAIRKRLIAEKDDKITKLMESDDFSHYGMWA